MARVAAVGEPETSFSPYPSRASRREEEAALMAAVAAGDRGPALRQLYRSYEGRLYGLGLKLLGDASLAEELVQETFVRVWRKADQFDPDKGTVATFVFTIARHIAVDLWRRPSSRPFEPATDDEAAPGDAMERVVLSIAVRHALDGLSPAHREVLELSYRRDLKQSQIAERLGVPLGTVKTRTYHALRALKAALEAGGVDG
jgi:RNA polymerase sigma-70 factor (ECF subfamily)